MKRSFISFISNYRFPLSLLFVSLGVAVFCTLSWNVGAQQDARAAMKAKRIQADNELMSVGSASAGARVAPMPAAEKARRERANAPEGTASCSLFNTLVYAYDFFDDHLYSFRASDPSTYLTNVQLTGLAADEFLLGLDYRPSTGQIYAMGSNDLYSRIRVYTVNTTTGELTPVGTPATPTTDLFYAVDFNPVADLIRVSGDADSNRRFNPGTGDLVGTDTPLVYVAGDPGAGVNPNVVHVAYSNNFVGATTTTLYGLDSNRDTLVTIGGINGTPSPNSGLLTSVGPAGSNFTGFGGFDIQPATNNAFASLRVFGAATLHSINLTNGAATSLGAIGSNGPTIDGLTVMPCQPPFLVEVGGRVTTPDGYGVRGAIVTITDSQNVTRRTTTSSFGYYSFAGVEAGRTYTVAVVPRRFTFSEQVVQVNAALTNLDFTAD